MTAHFVEDKTCRICGVVDAENINFLENKWKNLQYKIITIFPIIIYRSDPLPKNICRKCMAHVLSLYEEHQKVIKVQKKWIDNVKANQPDNHYIQILNIIEKNNKNTEMQIRSILPEYIHQESRILLKPPRISENDTKEEEMNGTISTLCSHAKNILISNNSVQKNIETNTKDWNKSTLFLKLLNTNEITIEPRKAKTNNNQLEKKSKTDLSNIEKIKELQNKLKSNGCTLMSLSSSSNKAKSLITMQASVESSEICKYCNTSFPNVKLLAKHQLCHLILQCRKLYEKKYLDKRSRRGRVIISTNKKSIRCLNCWKLFLTNKMILDHWSHGECDFYCQICGKDFPNEPKMLREHVSAIHKISYKSSRKNVLQMRNHSNLIVRDLFNKTAKPFVLQSFECSSIPKIKTEPFDEQLSMSSLSSVIINKPQTKSTNKLNTERIGKSISSKTQCDICLLKFPSVQSRNAHMRKHKNRTEKDVDKIKINEKIQIKDFSTNVSNANKNSTTSIEFNPGLLQIRCEIKEEPIDLDKMQSTNSEGTKLKVRKLSELQDPSIIIKKTLRSRTKRKNEKQQSKISTSVLSK